MRSDSSAISYFAVLLLAAAAVLFSFWKTASNAPYHYDESDYMYAGTRGFLSNFLDRPSLSTVEFVRKGLELSRDKTKRSDMSQYVRSRGDITFYRHYHGPLYAYWIVFCQAMGFRDPASFRASGLIIHVVLCSLIFWMFRVVFRQYPPIAALAAALAFLLNRSALVTATIVTQHVLFNLMAALTLFFLALFCRDRTRRYWYAAAACLGLSFATVETAFILAGTTVLILVLVEFRSRWKKLALLFVQGTVACIAAVLVVWPKGILQLGVLKGYVYLGYIALAKRTFSPMGPGEMWSFKFRTYPLEFIVPALALIAAAVWWRKLSGRREVLPFLLYAWMFVAVTMVITVPYTYYHGSLFMSCAVVVGVLCGELWLRPNLIIRLAAAVVLVGTLAGMVALYYREASQPEPHDDRVDVLDYIDKNLSAAQQRVLYVPFELVPTIHFYHPEMNTVGYDKDWSSAALAKALAEPGTEKELVCEDAVCGPVREDLPPAKPVVETRLGVFNSLIVENGR